MHNECVYMHMYKYTYMSYAFIHTDIVSSNRVAYTIPEYMSMHVRIKLHVRRFRQMYTDMSVCLRLSRCMYVWAGVHFPGACVCMRACLHIRIHTHTYVHTYKHPSIHTYICVTCILYVFHLLACLLRALGFRGHLGRLRPARVCGTSSASSAQPPDPPPRFIAGVVKPCRGCE